MRSFLLPSILLISGLYADTCTAATSVVSSPATAAQAKSTGFTGKLVRAWNVQDKSGEHLLVLSTWTVPTSVIAGEDRIDILATLFERKNGAWKPEWKIADGIDCHTDMDQVAKFKSDDVTITDLDNNGLAEVTVAYTLFCGGGIDDSILKVIMRQGATKFALRGTTKLVYKDMEEDFGGGEMKLDPSLARPEDRVFARHLKAVRDRVYLIKH